MPFAKLFRSRWSALFWAGGMLWTAVDVADSAPQRKDAVAANATATDATGTPVDKANLDILAQVIGNGS